MSESFNAVVYGRYRVSLKPTGFFDGAVGDSPKAMPAGTQSFRGRLTGADINIKVNSGDPSTLDGEPVNNGQDMLLDDSMIQNIRWCSSTDRLAELRGHFYTCKAALLIGG